MRYQLYSIRKQIRWSQRTCFLCSLLKQEKKGKAAMAEEYDVREQMRAMPVVYELPGMDSG